MSSPVGAPSDVAGGQIFVARGLLDQDIHLLLEVLLVELSTNLLPKLLLLLLLLGIGRVGGGRCELNCLTGSALLVRVVELETTELVLNALNNYLSDLVQLILTSILVLFLLKQLAELVVFHMSRELALSHIATSSALIVPLHQCDDVINYPLTVVGLLSLLNLSDDIYAAIALFTFLIHILHIDFVVFALLLFDYD